ncbi:small heat shock protein, chloroplastic-like [Mercurialis annua]|uniref:small heat shock protein, chloroplastic-like n=1 Tax=Mercurialis annua TaxID=3986 RepID=UPI00215FBEC3|nr:small heat shock protein, chloroplastic-like [Mercurialis annua]
MSQSVSNFSLSLPLLSRTNSTRSRNNPVSFLKTNGVIYNFPHTRRISSTKAMAAAAESRDNLDHLQRPNANQQQPSQPKKRVAPVSPVGLWDRFPTARTVEQMMETMERIMEDPFTYSTNWSTSSPSPMNQRNGFGRGRTPWEIKEAENEYKLRFDMPGMTKQDVKIWVEDKMLVLKAEKKVEKQDEDDDEEWSAKSYGKYSSRIALPENIQFEKIKAEVRDGVLYISIPKATSFAKILDINVE